MRSRNEVGAGYIVGGSNRSGEPRIGDGAKTRAVAGRKLRSGAQHVIRRAGQRRQLLRCGRNNRHRDIKTRALHRIGLDRL